MCPLAIYLFGGNLILIQLLLLSVHTTSNSWELSYMIYSTKLVIWNAISRTNNAQPEIFFKILSRISIWTLSVWHIIEKCIKQFDWWIFKFSLRISSKLWPMWFLHWDCYDFVITFKNNNIKKTNSYHKWGNRYRWSVCRVHALKF